MRSIPFTISIFICLIVWELGSSNSVALSCDSCGSECARACGTRHFRTCCFNYVKKRATNFHPYSLSKIHYDMLYGPFTENDINRKPIKNDQDTISRNENLLTQIEGDVSDARNHQNFYKPWKDENDVVLIDEQQQQQQQQQQRNRQATDSKQQYVYDV